MRNSKSNNFCANLQGYWISNTRCKTFVNKNKPWVFKLKSGAALLYSNPYQVVCSLDEYKLLGSREPMKYDRSLWHRDASKFWSIFKYPHLHCQSCLLEAVVQESTSALEYEGCCREQIWYSNAVGCRRWLCSRQGTAKHPDEIEKGHFVPLTACSRGTGGALLLGSIVCWSARSASTSTRLLSESRSEVLIHKDSLLALLLFDLLAIKLHLGYNDTAWHGRLVVLQSVVTFWNGMVGVQAVWPTLKIKIRKTCQAR